MASYPKPSENLPIFDALVFLTPLNATITLAEADAKYLARQDTAVSIAQTTSFSDNITIGNSLLDYIPAQGLQIKPTVMSEAVFVRVLDGTGATKQRIECNQTHTHLYDQTRITESATPTNYTSLQQTGESFALTNNITGGSLTLGTALITTVPITLPTAGVAPSLAQIGGTTLVTSGGSTNPASGVYKTNATSPTLAVGTYLFHGISYFNCSVAGTVTQMVSTFSSSSGTSPTVTSQLGTSLNSNASTQQFAVAAPISTVLTSSCIVTVTSPAIYYLNCYWVGTSATFAVGGEASFTRIA